MLYFNAVTILLSFSVLLLNSRSVIACDCAEPAEILTRFDESDVVFVGYISEQEPDYEGTESDRRRINFVVEQAWKGLSGTQVGIVTTPGGSRAGCGYYGNEGNRVLVYLSEDPQAHLLEGHLCSDVSFYDEDFELYCRDDLSIYCAENHIAAFESTGLSPLELREGPDEQYPPLRLREQEPPLTRIPGAFSGTPEISFCGAGILMPLTAVLVCLLLFVELDGRLIDGEHWGSS